MYSKFIGGILLIVGTSVGGGMLALPIVNAATGFWLSSLVLLLCWAIMTLGALFILEASLYLPPGKHMISMAAATLGKPGLLLTWLSYIFLLYTLLAGYISGGGDVFGRLFENIGFNLLPWQTSIIFTLIFSLIVYKGIRQVDLLNRWLMIGKLGAFLLLVFLIAPEVNHGNYQISDYHNISNTIMILITSFGFAIIIPNLRTYFNKDIINLKKVIYIGSLIPLLCYIAWDAVIIGTIPSNGDSGLISLIDSTRPTSTLFIFLRNIIDNNLINLLFKFFTSICMLTTFLGVSLCLITFLADGLKFQQHGKEGLILYALTFLPPLVLVIYYPGLYLSALSYAGIFCIILLLLLPSLMILNGRRKNLASAYYVPGGIYTPLIIICIAITLVINALI